MHYRNNKRYPKGLKFLGKLLQPLAIFCLLAPKVALISYVLIYAPFTFPVMLILEYFMLISYNYVCKRSWQRLTDYALLATLICPAFFGSFLSKKKILLHDVVLHILSAVLYAIVGITMRLTIFSNHKDFGFWTFAIGSYFGGIALYLVFAAIYYKKGHVFNIYLREKSNQQKNK